MQRDIRLDALKKDVEAAFTTRERALSILPNGNPANWIFDFRPLLLQSESLDRICELFWQHIGEFKELQIGGLETAAIALVAGMLMKGRALGRETRGFYIRKSRRKDGFQKQIEGELTDAPIVLVDDALNSGRSIMRQIEAIEAEGKRVRAVCVIIRYRDVSFYTALRERGIKILSLFTLDDFPVTGGMVKNAETHEVAPLEAPFQIEWKFQSPNPTYYFTLPKSAPVLDEERVYFGADNGTMWALNQKDGSVAWNFKTLFGAGKKRIFSSPALCNGMLYFGAYDGNFYALDAKTGTKKWVYFDADWIGSSPCVAPELGSVFVGLEFGLWRKEGGIVALDLISGEKKWSRQFPSFAHSSPAYSSKFNAVVIGSTEGIVRAFNAETGDERWSFRSGKAVRGGFAFDEGRGLVCFGSEDKDMYIISMKDGSLVHRIETLEPIYSTPVVHNGRLYFGVLDKRVFCIDLDAGKIVWEHWAHSRIFATPEFVDGSLFIGSNDGRLYELDENTGKEKNFFQVTERIVNKIAYEPRTKRYFLPTYANEIYCLKRVQK